MVDVFICYARVDKDFALKLRDRLGDQKREVRIDLKDVPPTTEWWTEICAHIEAADNFVFLISPDSCGSDTCRQEIAYAEANHKRLIPVVYRSVRAKELPPALARIQWISFTDDTFERAFESLIEALDTDVDWVRSHTRVLVRALEWDRNGRDRSFLLRGVELESAVRWLAQVPAISEPKSSALQEEYIRASQKSEAEEKDRIRHQVTKLRRRAFVIAVILLLAFGAAGLAYWQRTKAYAHRLVTMSISAESTDPELSVLIATQALATTWRWDHTILPEAEQQLHNAIMTSHVRLTLQGHNKGVRSVAWSPNGKRLASASEDGTAKVWDSGSGRQLLTVSPHGSAWAVTGVAWSPDGSMLALASQDGTASIWQLETGKRLSTLLGQGIQSVEWSPNGKQLVTEGNHAIKLWDATTGQEVLTLRGRASDEGRVAWSPDGKRLATGTGDNTATVWDAGTGKEVITFHGHGNPVASVAWSRDGKRLATASMDHTVRVWDVHTGGQLLGWSVPMVWSVAWSPDGARLATGASDNTAKVWNCDTGEQLAVMLGHAGGVEEVAWSPDGTRLATGSGDSTVKIWDPEVGKEQLIVTGHTREINSVAWSPDGERLATGGWDRTARVWNAETGEQLLTVIGHQSEVLSVAWSPDGKFLATGSGQPFVAGLGDRTAKVWDAKSGEELVTLTGHDDAVLSVSWSPDGTRVATTSRDETSKIWDARTGRELRSLNALGIAWSPDGTRLITLNGSLIHVFTPDGGTILSTLNSDDNLVKVAWSPEGKRLAVTTGSLVKVLDFNTGKTLATLSGHSADVSTLAWSPDGKRLATGSADHDVKVWDAETGNALLTLGGHGDWVWSVAWSPNGKRLATASADGTAHVYVVDVHELMEIARQRVTFHPSDEACKRYLGVDKCPPVATLE